MAGKCKIASDYKTLISKYHICQFLVSKLLSYGVSVKDRGLMLHFKHQ